MIEDAVDRMKTEAGDVTLIAVGGGAFLRRNTDRGRRRRLSGPRPPRRDFRGGPRPLTKAGQPALGNLTGAAAVDPIKEESRMARTDSPSVEEVIGDTINETARGDPDALIFGVGEQREGISAPGPCFRLGQPQNP
jgi:hypothetical protein